MVRRNWIEASTRFSMAEFDDSMMIRGSELRENDDQVDRKFLCDAYSRLVQTTSEHSAKLESMVAMLFETKNTLSQLSNRLGQHPIDAEFSQHIPPVTNCSDPYVHDDSMEALLREMKQAPSIEMPEFDASNVSDWLSKVERSFRVHRYSDLDKLNLVAFRLEGAVLNWFNWEMTRREFRSWDEFRHRLFLRFGAAPAESPGNRLFAIKQTGTVSASVTELEELSAQVIEQQPVYKEEYIPHLQIPVSKLQELSLQMPNESPSVCETSQDVDGCVELDTDENVFSGLSQISQVWEPGGVLADHVLMDWLMDFNGYDGIVDGIKCLDIGVCSGIKQPINSRRASRVWERGGLAISTDRILHSGFDGDKLTELDCHLSENHSQEKVRVEMLMQATSFNGDFKLSLHHVQQNGFLVFPWNLMLLEFFLFFYFGRQAVLDQITKGLEMKKKMKVLKSWMFKYKPATSSSMLPFYVNHVGVSDIQDSDKEMVAALVTQAVLNLVTNAGRFGLVSVLIWLTVLRVLWLMGTLFWSTSFKKQKFGKNWWYKFKHSLWQGECDKELLEVEVVLAETVVDVRCDDVGHRELLVKWQDLAASESLWMLSKDFVLLYLAVKLEDKLRFEGGSIVMNQQAYFRRKKEESESSKAREVSSANRGFAENN